MNTLTNFKVQTVTALADLKVQKVSALPNGCGKWQEVTALPDFTIQMVTALPDFSIQEVSALPGLGFPGQ